MAMASMLIGYLYIKGQLFLQYVRIFLCFAARQSFQ
jgi:hypothetical protein